MKDKRSYNDVLRDEAAEYGYSVIGWAKVRRRLKRDIRVGLEESRIQKLGCETCPMFMRHVRNSSPHSRRLKRCVTSSLIRTGGLFCKLSVMS